MDALPPPAAGDPFAATLPPSLPSPSSSSSFNLSPSLLIIAALLAFVVFASVSIHLLLRCLARSSSSHRAPSPLPTRARRASEEEAEVGSTRRSAAAVAPEEAQPAEEVVDDEKERLIASLPLFTMASALAALPKSSPDCAVCLSPFSPDAELRLLPACRHAFHAACVDAWLRTTPSCPLCRTAVSLPHPPLPTAPPPPPPPAVGPSQQELLDSRVSSSNNNSRSFRVEIGSVSNRRSSAAGDDRRTYSLGSFDYRVDEEVEAIVSRITRPAVSAAAKSATTQAAPATPGEALAEAAGSRGWLREYVDRLASSASSLSGRWSARWSQGGHHSRSQSQSHRQEDSWRWDPEAVTGAAMHRAPDEEEPAFVALYRWIVGV
ncbi:E3 ubiquitin-protein ligase ATL4-like [Miscanthus floridulus]|uniref:E3 ubiquitin-protein ligase ATL4-like n=1 Tax=Miscanthus floridulus TaxID=154761 RepID=UPI0034587865